MHKRSLFSTSSPTLFFFLMVPILTGIRRYLIVVLSCIALRLVMLSTFSYHHWPFVCLLLRNVYSSPLSVLMGLFYYLILSYWSHFCIFNINPSSDRWSDSISLHCIGCLCWLLSLLGRNFLIWSNPICPFFLLLSVLVYTFSTQQKCLSVQLKDYNFRIKLRSILHEKIYYSTERTICMWGSKSH